MDLTLARAQLATLINMPPETEGRNAAIVRLTFHVCDAEMRANKLQDRVEAAGFSIHLLPGVDQPPQDVPPEQPAN